jgi:hypothetical protein
LDYSLPLGIYLIGDTFLKFKLAILDSGFFDELKKDVTSIQNILEEDSSYLDEHKAMIKMRELMQ